MQLFCFRVSCQPIEIRLLEPFQMKRSCRLHLCFFLRLRSLAHLSLGFPIVYLSILFRPHQKYTAPYMRMSRARPRTVYLWWSRWVPPPGPDRFITLLSTTVSYLYYFCPVMSIYLGLLAGPESPQAAGSFLSILVS